ncbi:hypothetical protein BS50DRAFT_592787 [Corynespora cassiicola Philippines]|uniref:Ubiquitin-like protease family profile domain-containing protein n=1 Tax=Corynespora cassiicola Philippines TaxID=1448308 RepID=A0A2T2N8V2_CORCC|nr:hypothetical protein BS50DRAFT_592787 [Corynespora cassiicola Philippines]
MPKRKHAAAFQPHQSRMLHGVGLLHATPPFDSPASPILRIPGQWPGYLDRLERVEPLEPADFSVSRSLFQIVIGAATAPILNILRAVSIYRSDGASKRRLVSPEKTESRCKPFADRIRANRSNGSPRFTSPERDSETFAHPVDDDDFFMSGVNGTGAENDASLPRGVSTAASHPASPASPPSPTAGRKGVYPYASKHISRNGALHKAALRHSGFEKPPKKLQKILVKANKEKPRRLSYNPNFIPPPPPEKENQNGLPPPETTPEKNTVSLGQSPPSLLALRRGKEQVSPTAKPAPALQDNEDSVSKDLLNIQSPSRHAQIYKKFTDLSPPAPEDEFSGISGAQLDAWLADFKSRASYRQAEDPQAEVAVEDLAVPSEYDNDLSFLPDAPTPLPRKHVTFDSTRKIRPFYSDRPVSFVLDSQLDSAKSTPVRPTLSKVPPKSKPTPDQDVVPETTVAFRGVPADTWDISEDTIDVSEMLFSSELACEIHHQVAEEKLHEVAQEKLKLDVQPKAPADKDVCVLIDSDDDAPVKPQVEAKKKSVVPPAVFPPPSPTAPLVVDLNSSEREILLTAAAKAEHGQNPSVLVSKSTNAKSFGTLLPHMFSGDPMAWLDDDVVNEYLSIIVERENAILGWQGKASGKAPPVHAFVSQWYLNMSQGYHKVERWARRFNLNGKRFLDAELVLFPICHGNHWRLLVIKPKERHIDYLDSMDRDSKNSTSYVNLALEFLRHELGPLFVRGEWTVTTKQRSAAQINGSDCGVFTVLNALAFIRKVEPSKITVSNGMEDARRRIAYTIIEARPPQQST